MIPSTAHEPRLAGIAVALLPQASATSPGWNPKDSPGAAAAFALRSSGGAKQSRFLQTESDLFQSLIEPSRSAQPTENPKGILTSMAEIQPSGSDESF